MNVLVIPEDFRKDQYILKPIIAAMLVAVGGPRATVRVCQDPLLGGIGEALKWERIEEILRRYRYQVDLFLLCVDRDGEAGRRDQLDRLERQAATSLGEGCLLLAENAWQELEVWTLAGHDFLPGWRWAAIRAERDPKERYFAQLARQRTLLLEPGGGRKTLSEEAARRYGRIRRRCPQDIAALEDRIRAWARR
jgi:hypothetical protein